jgi:hypothetical protein
MFPISVHFLEHAVTQTRLGFLDPLLRPVVTYLLHPARSGGVRIASGSTVRCVSKLDFQGDTIMRFQAAIQVLAVVMLSFTAACGQAEGAKPAAAAANGAKIDNPHVWSPRTRSVAVFKNGFGFFVRDGEVTLRDGWSVAKEIPPAAFGTLAIYSMQEKELVDVVGSGPGEVVDFDGVDVADDVEVKRSRLVAAQGINVQLTYDYKGSERSAAGRLVSVGPDFAVLESDNNSFAVPVAGVTRLQILELPLRIHVRREGAEPAAKTKIGMAYLREGITWIPEYSLRVLDDTTAELTLRGTLVNEAEDLIHCDVNFVVGVPHFAHTQFMAPIAVGQVIRSIGSAVAPMEVRSQIMSRAAIANNSIVANQFEGASVVEKPVAVETGKLSGALGNLPQLEGPGGTDYTVYTKQDLTIRRGERAIVTLFVKKIRYSHIYRWSPPELMQHFLVLHNDTDSAWTTGPCVAVSGDRPLSEDLLRYTPKGGRGEIPVTAAINISHEQNEVEAERKFKAHSPSDRVYYDLVTLEGELRLKNFERNEVELVIAANVPGRPLEASDDGVRSTDSTRLKLLERSGAIRWKVKLKPDESKQLKYKYER